MERIVNYADDFVILTRRGRADQAMTTMRGMMQRLRLTVNETKTRICRLPDETFDFLGYTFARQYSRRTGRPYIGPRPSKKKIGRICDEISAVTERRTNWREPEELVAQLNAKLRGWSNYFRLGLIVPAYETVMGHARRRLRRWLGDKHKVRTQRLRTLPQ
jgi:hypothetical protein